MTPVFLALALGVFAILFPWNLLDRMAGREDTQISWTTLRRVPRVKHVSAHFDLCLADTRATCVVDGASIRVDGNEFRIPDIEVPNLADPRCESERILALRASARLTKWVNEGAFDLLPNPEGRHEDAAGHELRVLSRNGVSAGDALVADGVVRRAGGKGRRWC